MAESLYRIFFVIHLSMHILAASPAIVNSAAVNVGMQLFSSFSLPTGPRVELLDRVVTLFLFLRNWRYSPLWLLPIYTPPEKNKKTTEWEGSFLHVLSGIYCL